MVAPATVGFLELLVFFFATRFTMILRLDSFFAVRFLAGDFRFATRLRETAFFAGFRLAVVLRFIVRFLATDFFLTIRFLETAFFAGFRLAVVLRFIVRFLATDFFLTIRFLETAFFAGFRLAVVLRFIVRFLATIFLAAFFTVLGFLVLAFEPRDVVLLVAISHLN